MNILICDNDPGILRSLEILLARVGSRIRCFTDPVQALGHLKENPGYYNALIADYFMPTINGLDQIRQSRRYLASNARVMLITGHLDRLPDLDTARQETDALLGKPFCLEGLRAIVESWPVSHYPSS